VNLSLVFDQIRYHDGSGYVSMGNLTGLKNVIGTDGNDLFYADATDNRFFGGLGNDCFEGADGANDTFAVDGTLVDYALSESGGTYTMTGISGTNIFIDVEFVDVGGTTYDIGALDLLI